MNSLKQKYDQHTWIPDSIIQDAIDHKWETSLAYFILLRSKYKNPIFYNFTYRILSEKSGISSAVLCRHVKVLISKGMANIHCGNLMMIGTNKIKDKGMLLPVKIGASKRETILNIQFTRTLKNFHQQKKVAKTKIEIIKMQQGKKTETKKAKMLLKASNRLFNQSTEKSSNNYYMLSNKKFGSLNNRSQSTGRLIQKRLNDCGLIISKPNTLKVSEARYSHRSFYSMCLPGKFTLSKNGFIFKVMPNKIFFPMQQ